jgi:hypothetical protein
LRNSRSLMLGIINAGVTGVPPVTPVFWKACVD